MLINNRHVQGIFLYTENSSQVEFEKNDFVVSGDCIYLCTAENPTNRVNNTVSGIDPADDTRYENFKPYPGERAITAKEYFEIIEGGYDVEDKYVSSQAILGILQRYNFGLSMTGIVKDYIKEGETNMVLGYNTSAPLDDLILTKDLNNGVVYVDPRLEQIQNGVTYNGSKFSVLFGYSENSKLKDSEYNLILRQYTYQATDTIKTRVQELVNPFSAIVVFRYITWENDNFPGDISSISGWKSSYSYSKALKDKINTLEAFYQDSQNQWESRFNTLSGMFRFKKEVVVDEEYADLSEGIYTVSVSKTENNGMICTDTVTVKIDPSFTGQMYKVSAFGSSYYLETAATGSLGVTRLRVGRDSMSFKIIEIYGRKDYE